MQLDVHGYELTLRLADADKILVDPDARNVRHEDAEAPVTHDEFAYGGYNKIEHPGLGEGGRYHDAEAADPLPEGEPLTFALAGNQNSGKTTLFNQLTGANQAISPASLWTGKTAGSAECPIRRSRIFRVFIPCRPIPTRNW